MAARFYPKRWVRGTSAKSPKLPKIHSFSGSKAGLLNRSRNDTSNRLFSMYYDAIYFFTKRAKKSFFVRNGQGGKCLKIVPSITPKPKHTPETFVQHNL